MIKGVPSRPLDEELFRIQFPHFLKVFVIREDPLSYILPALDTGENSLSGLISKHLLLLFLHGIQDHRLLILLWLAIP